MFFSLTAKCCNRKQKAKIYLIDHQNKDIVFLSYVKIIEECKYCKQKVVEVLSFDYQEKVIEARKIKRKYNDKFLKTNQIIREVRQFNTASGKTGWFLWCWVHGRKEKCYSNLRNLKIGKQSIDDGINYKKTL